MINVSRTKHKGARSENVLLAGILTFSERQAAEQNHSHCAGCLHEICCVRTNGGDMCE